MRTKTLAVSFGTALVLTIGSISGWALATPIVGPGGTVGNDPKPPMSTSGTSQSNNDNSQQTNALYPGGGSNGGESGNGGNGLGGGPSASSTVKKLQGNPLNICQTRQTNINNIFNRVVTRGTNQLNFFSSVTTKVEGFVTSKNLTIPNYSQMVATLSSDQSKVGQDIANLKANDTFSCTSTNPTSTAATFKSGLQQEVTDLQTYRNDIKTLIQAIKSVAQTNQSSSSNSSGGSQ